MIFPIRMNRGSSIVIAHVRRCSFACAFVCCALLTSFGVTESEAQLSQLDFDSKAEQKEASKPSPEPEDVEALLEERKPDKRPLAVEADTPAEARSAAKDSKPPTQVIIRTTFPSPENGPAEGRNVILIDQPELPAEQRTVAARTKGPAADSGNNSTITSKTSWELPQKGCAEPGTQREFYLKAKALKEVLYRFSGNDEFYNRLNTAACEPLCDTKGVSPWVSGLAVPSGSGETFRMVAKDNRCFYVLEKPAKGSWGSLEGQRVVCNCLPDRFR